jgi:arylsulfatase A-like enzyme
VPDVVRLEDVAPTLLEVCGLSRLPVSDGQSLAAGLGGRVARAWQAPQDLLAVRARRDLPGIDRAAAEVGIRSVLDGKWHLLDYSDGRRELYDLVNDPAETTNVAEENGEEVLRLAPLLPNGE